MIGTKPGAMSFAKRILFFSFLALPLLAALPVHAQMPDYHVRAFSEKDGVRPSKIVDMIRDGNGFLWLLYSDRAIRFDGKQTKEFWLEDGLESIVQGKDGQIWANSGAVLYKYINGQKGFLPVAVDTTGHPQLISIVEIPNGGQRLLTNKGFYQYSLVQNQFVPSSVSMDISGGLMGAKLSYGFFKNVFFHVSEGVVFSMNLKTGQKKQMALREEFFGMFPINGHTLLVSDWKDRSFIYDFSNKSIRPVSVPGLEDGNNEVQFRTDQMVSLKNGLFLLATSKGLLEYNPKTGEFRPLRLFFNGHPFTDTKIIRSLYLDKQQNIWASSNTDLILFNPFEPQIGLYRNFGKDPKKGFSDQIRNFAVDKKNNLWMATLNGFAYLNRKTGKVTPFPPTLGATDRLNHRSVRGMAFDGKKLIIGQTNRGIWLYDPETRRYERPTYEPGLERDDFIDQIYSLNNGDHVIVGASTTQLMDGETYHIKTIEYPGARENPMFCYQDSSNRVWIATTKDLYCFSPDMEYEFRAAVKDWENHPWCMVQWDKNEFFIGSRGLFKVSVSGNSAKIKKAYPYFDDIRINILYKDHNEKLWLGTGEGLFSLAPKSGHIEKYDYFDNVQTGLFYLNSVCRVPDGLLFMGGSAGFNYFYPEKIKPHNDSLRVSLLQVTVNGGSVGSYPDFSSLDLSHSQKNIEISFSAPYFKNPSSVNYRYKMEGANEEWIEVKTNNSVRFASLSPGDYSFSVAASINGRDWYETQTPLSISISPPFWQTWWFICLLVLLGATLIYLWVRNLLKRIRAEEILNRFATSLFGQNTVEDTFWDVAQNCIYLLGFEDCVVYRYDGQKQKLVQIAAAGPKGDPIKHKVYGAMEIPLGKGIVGAVAKTQRPEIVKDARKDPRYIMDDQKRLSEISVPIIVDGKTYGVIDSEHSKKGFYTRWHFRVLEKIAHLCSEKISRYLTAEEIRAKIAQDLHDDMGSTLSSINILSKIAMEQRGKKGNTLSHLQKISHSSSEMMESLDDIIWAINPEHDTLDEIGLHMKEYAAELLEPAGMDYVFEQGCKIEKTRFALSRRKDLFLIFKEALNNSLKYSNATKIQISMKKESNSIVLSINDNGIGFDTTVASNGNGLKNMQNRAKNIDACLKIESTQGNGTTVSLKIPIT